MRPLLLGAMALTAPFAVPKVTLAQGGQGAMPRPNIAASVVHDDVFPKVAAAYANGVEVLPEVRYWTPNGFRPLTMDIYLPPKTIAKPATGFPMIMYIHGGGWIVGDSHLSGPIIDFPGLLADMAARGYVVTSVNYRLSGEARWPAQAQDIKAAIKFLRIRAADYGIDPARFVTWGASAGGHLSAIAGVSCGVSALQPGAAGNSTSKPDEIVAARVSDCVQAAVSWYGIFDLSSEAAQARANGVTSHDRPTATEWLLLGCFKDGCTPEQIRSASPTTYVNRDTPPMLLLVGDQDRTVPHEQTMEMDTALTTAGVNHETHVYPGVDHGLLGTTAEATRQANQDAIERTIRFIEAAIGTSRGPGTR
jgi:acetyl esterase/lipase